MSIPNSIQTNSNIVELVTVVLVHPDVRGPDVEDFLAEAFDEKLRDTNRPCPIGVGNDGGISGFTVWGRFGDHEEMHSRRVAQLPEG